MAKTKSEIMHRANFKRYGMTWKHFDELLEEQDGKCAICGQPETATRNGIVRRLCVDHIHEGNIPRGLLCARCNSGLGYFKDDVELLEKAIFYLRTNVGFLPL
jgi:hypothetical protein